MRLPRGRERVFCKVGTSRPRSRSIKQQFCRPCYMGLKAGPLTAGISKLWSSGGLWKILRVSWMTETSGEGWSMREQDCIRRTSTMPVKRSGNKEMRNPLPKQLLQPQPPTNNFNHHIQPKPCQPPTGAPAVTGPVDQGSTST